MCLVPLKVDGVEDGRGSGLVVEYRLLVEADYDALAQLWWESWRSTGLTVA
jgi:hypothetical protein